MQVVKISFKNDNGKYEFFATSQQLNSILADDLFTATNVDAKSGKLINHGEEIKKALGLKDAPEDDGE